MEITKLTEKDAMKVIVETHIDGVWNTSREIYKDCEIVLKSRTDRGMKAHCMIDGKEAFTYRFNFIDPNKLLAKMKRRIDMMKSGEWTPIKLLKNGK